MSASPFPTAAAISSACRALKFSAPPPSKKVLKQRFLELAKENHPDRAKAKGLNVNAATKRMAQLTEAYKTLQTVVAAGAMGGMVNNGTFIRNNNSGSGGVGARGSKDAASAGFGMGENIEHPTEYQESPEDLAARRRDSFERTWLPWQKMRRESCDKARPIDEETAQYRYLYGHRIPNLSMKVLMGRFWKNYMPMRQKQLLLKARYVIEEKACRMVKAAKFVVTGK